MSEPRHDVEAEKIIIGTVLMDERAIRDCDVTPEDFWSPHNEQLWAFMLASSRSGKPVNMVTVSQHLIEGGVLGCGPAYLHECLALGTDAAAVGHYCMIIGALAKLRRIGSVGVKLSSDVATAPWEDADQALNRARAELDAAAATGTSGVRVVTFADALAASIEEWQSPKVKGFPTGWPDLDQKLNGGWHPGQLTIIGARPAVGKSVVAGCAAVAAAQYGAGFFSLEMRQTEVVGRMAAASQNIPLANLNSQELTDQDWSKIAALVEKSATWPVYIEDKSRLSMAQIHATVRSWARRGPVPLIIIDYLQLLTPADRTEQRERQVSRLAEDCKHLAKEFNTHVVALAQLNRGLTSRADPRPVMSDLRESGGIEAHADNIILLHREPDSHYIEFIIGKNRHGETGKLDMIWRPHYASVNSEARAA